MKQQYLVKKYNADGCNYDNRSYSTYKDAWADTGARDEMLICKAGAIYYGDNWRGWCADPADVLRVVTRHSRRRQCF